MQKDRPNNKQEQKLWLLQRRALLLAADKNEMLLYMSFKRIFVHLVAFTLVCFTQ